MYDFIAIGDVVIDAFIKLQGQGANVTDNGDTLCLSFGDKIPYESVEEVPAVGNSSNAAVAAARLGLKSALVTNVGQDANGLKCLDRLKSENVSTDFIVSHADKITNYHYVLWFNDDRTILVKHQEYQRVFSNVGKPKWLYLSSMGADTLEYHKEILNYLNKNPEINLAFQPGTFQISLGLQLADIYKRSKIFFCNVAEAGKILGIDTLGTQELLKRMQALGPQIVVITDGPNGAYAYDGDKFYTQAPYPDPKPPYERTGAGDAFASTCVAALALGNSLEEALKWGAVNSMSVVQQVGAQKGLLTLVEIQKYLK